MSNKTPQPGEWWEYNGVRIHLAGKTTKGLLSCEYKDGTMAVLRQGDHWQHLADCTGFDWQPETFPQYWGTIDGSTKPVAYLRRTATDTFYHVYSDGCEHGPYTWIRQEEPHRKQITKKEAESRIGKPQPAESPDDWVVQDRVPARPGIDQGWFEYDYYRTSVAKRFWNISGMPEHAGRRHGDRVDLSGDLATFELRCRRKDLPSLGPLGDQISWFKADAMPPLPNKFATLANEIEQLRADVMRRCDELGVRLTELEEGGNG